MVPGAIPKARGTLRVDHAALRLALGSNSEIIQTMEAKARGKPGVNVGVIWRYYAKRTIMRRRRLPRLR
jgi:hypothetical protein